MCEAHIVNCACTIFVICKDLPHTSGVLHRLILKKIMWNYIVKVRNIMLLKFCKEARWIHLGIEHDMPNI